MRVSVVMEEEKLQIDFLPEEKKLPTPWFTYFCALTASVMAMSLGLSISWISPVIPKLSSNDTDINPLGRPLTTLEVSLLPVFLFSATTFTYPLWGKVVDKIGRKPSLRLLAVMLILSLTLTAFANHYYIYCITLTGTGASVAGSVLAASVYINEIAEDRYRGTLASLLGLQFPLGLLYGFLCGAIYGVRVFTLLCAVPAAIHLVLSIFITESPVFLIANHREVEAIEALEKLRNVSDMSVIEKQCKNLKEIAQATAVSKTKGPLEIFRNRNTRKAFFLATLIFVTEQLSGISIILAYVVTIIDKAQTTVTGNTVSVLIGVVKLVTYFVALLLMDRVGRRKLVLFSTLFCILPTFFIGVYSYLTYIHSHAFDNLGWLFITFVIVYVVAYSIGLGTVPLTFVGEVFPDDLRATGVGIVLGIDQILACTIAFSYPNLSELWGSHWCFWFCSLGTTIGFIIIYFKMPETKGKSFLEIQKMLSE